MKIIVCVKQVPDTSGKVAVNPDGTLNRASMAAITNPDDLNAVEAALVLKEQTGAEVVVVSMGPPPAEGMLREIIARGVDRAVLISAVSSAAPIPMPPLRSSPRPLTRSAWTRTTWCSAAVRPSTATPPRWVPRSPRSWGIPQVSYAAEITKEGKTLTIKRMLEDAT